MPLYTTEALILRTYKLGEADRIVVFLTRDRGKKRGVARGARRTRSRFGAALEPLTRAEVAYFEKERRELVGLNYAEATHSPLAAGRADAFAYVGYFAELIDEWAPEDDPNERLFRLGVSVAEALGAGVPVPPLARYFEYWLLRLGGVYPSASRCPRCGCALGGEEGAGACLAVGERAFTCRRCAAGDGRRAAVLSPEALAFLSDAARVAPDRVGDLALTPRAARELEAAHRALIVAHLEKEPKSVRVLRDMTE
jgi:DNA repair protein RecO (recombination protein O)